MPRRIEVTLEPIIIPRSNKELPTGLRLRLFQEKLLGKLGEYIDDPKGRVVQLSAPTGSGKTLTLILGYWAFIERGLRGLRYPRLIPYQ